LVRPADALSVLEQGYRRNPQASNLISALVQLYIREKKFERGIAACQQYIKQSPDDPMAYYLLGEIQTARGNYAEAEREFNTAIAQKPEWQKPHIALSKLYIAQGNKAGAIEKLEGALNANPSNPAAYLSLGQLYHQSKDYQKALALYEKALEINPNLWTAANNAAFMLTEYDGSLRALEKALNYSQVARNIQPDNPAVLDTQGWIYHKLGHNNRALGLIERAISIESENPVFNYHAGLILYRTGQQLKAKEKLQKALETEEPFQGRDEAEKILAELS
jgi:tetratricopeptide (TPR) repeat protein